MANTIYQYLTASRDDEEFQAARFDTLIELEENETTRQKFTNWITQIQACKGIGETGAKFLAMRVIDHLRKSDTARQGAKLYGEQLRSLQGTQGHGLSRKGK